MNDLEKLVDTVERNSVHDDLYALGATVESANTFSPDLELGALEPIIHEVTLRVDHPVLFAQILMRNLGEAGAMDEDEKLYWAKVALEMGPDWISKFRRLGAFMFAVDKAC